MQALAVDAQLLRAVLTPDLKLTVGRALSVRVAELLPGGRGTLSLAGVLLEAELPAAVRAGEELRLVVREVTPERVVLQLQDEPVQPQTPPPLGVPVPGFGNVNVTERDARGGRSAAGEEGAHLVALTYEAPSLGAVEMRFALSGEALRLAVTLPAGAPFELAQGDAQGLLDRLSAALDRPVSVTISPRREPLDLYA